MRLFYISPLILQFYVVCVVYCGSAVIGFAEDVTKQQIAAIEQALQSELQSERLAALAELPNYSGPKTLALIAFLCANPDWQVRELAAQAIAYQEPKKAKHLITKLAREKDPRVRAVVAIAAARVSATQQALQSEAADQRQRSSESYLKNLLTLADDKEARVRAAAARAMGEMSVEMFSERDYGKMVVKLAELSLDDSVEVSMFAVESLSKQPISEGRVTNYLIQVLGVAAEPVAMQAGLALQARPLDEYVKVLKRVVDKAKQDQREVIIAALGYIAWPLVDEFILAATKSRDWRVRAAAMEAMGHIAPVASVQLERYERFQKALRRGLEDSDWGVKTCAVFGLARLDDKEALPLMLGELRDLSSAKKGYDRFYYAILRQVVGGPIENDLKKWHQWYKQLGPNVFFRPIKELKSEASLSFYSVDEHSNNFGFVIDNSGSMRQRRKLVQAKEELLSAAEHLEFYTHFNVVQFDTTASSWQPWPVPGHYRNRFKLILKLRDTVPQDWTNIHDALALSLKQWGVEACYLLTDGEPTKGVVNKELLVEKITELNYDKRIPTRIHTLALDQRPLAAEFLTDLSRKNMGVARMIEIEWRNDVRSSRALQSRIFCPYVHRRIMSLNRLTNYLWTRYLTGSNLHANRI